MSLADRLMDLWITDPYKTAYSKALPAAKQAILKDLLDMLEDESCVTGGELSCDDLIGECHHITNNRLRKHLREAVRKYCE